MQLFDPKNPNEKKKMIAAAVLGVGAIVVLGYVFFGGSSTKPATNLNAKTVPSTTPARIARDSASVDNPVDDPSVFQPIKFDGTVSPVSDANRNIFAYYEPPPPLKVVIPPTPTPTPVPPVTLASLAPSNVYARTADFTLEVTGEKFTPAVRINLDGRELPTRFINAQQVGTTVPASLISNPGARMVMLRSSDG
ncbi:MAG TPA: hypothetical protein VHD88_07380, partial [Pyrinomonadaceae bacterium]|nr:hypothetical protein [Pyrinomonadaceae bacterium]